MPSANGFLSINRVQPVQVTLDLTRYDVHEQRTELGSDFSEFTAANRVMVYAGAPGDLNGCSTEE